MIPKSQRVKRIFKIVRIICVIELNVIFSEQTSKRVPNRFVRSRTTTTCLTSRLNGGEESPVRGKSLVPISVTSNFLLSTSSARLLSHARHRRRSSVLSAEAGGKQRYEIVCARAAATTTTTTTTRKRDGRKREKSPWKID